MMMVSARVARMWQLGCFNLCWPNGGLPVFQVAHMSLHPRRGFDGAMACWCYGLATMTLLIDDEASKVGLSPGFIGKEMSLGRDAGCQLACRFCRAFRHAPIIQDASAPHSVEHLHPTGMSTVLLCQQCCFGSKLLFFDEAVVQR